MADVATRSMAARWEVGLATRTANTQGPLWLVLVQINVPTTMAGQNLSSQHVITSLHTPIDPGDFRTVGRVGISAVRGSRSLSHSGSGLIESCEFNVGPRVFHLLMRLLPLNAVACDRNKDIVLPRP